MPRSIWSVVIALALSVGGLDPASAETAPDGVAGGSTRAAGPFAELLARTRIPYETFTLGNGLRVIVHEDRSAPVVAVSVWYNVGAKDEPSGRTGFAHLFEHLMFHGSENAPRDYLTYIVEMGATDINGSTTFDRTNYYQTVPVGALERTLFLESDRMGHLLGAVNQPDLANEIGVVQNEKRQGDNRPFGLVRYVQLEDLLPEGHPYRHWSIGSMADLSAGTLADVHQWFRDRYAPNNAVLVLAGDIDAARARPLVERYFGGIARGPVNIPAAVDVPTLPRRIDRLMHDRVANTRLSRLWVVPGLTDSDLAPLSVGAAILGELASSRLHNAMVRGDQAAASVTASVRPFQRISLFQVEIDLRPGQDAAAAGRRLDQLIVDFVREGPSDDEVSRAVMRTLAGQIQNLEQVNGRASALAEGMLYADGPGFSQARLAQLAGTTRAEVRAAMQRWLGRPVYALRIDPGEREPYAEAPVAAASAAVAAQRPVAPTDAGQPARSLPPVLDSPTLDFPDVERARLSNGIEVTYARRGSIPVTRIALEFDAGLGADPADQAGLHALMLGLLSEGTTTRTSIALAEAQERLGASIAADTSRDRTTLLLTALTPNVGPSLELLADIVRNPAFSPPEIERIRAQRLAAIAAARIQPEAMAAEAMAALLYGEHPYGRSPTGNDAAVRAASRDDIVRFHQRWIRPDTARIFAVGDLPLAQLLPQLEARFGGWRASGEPRGLKRHDIPLPAPRPRIVLIDRPQSPQSLVIGGQVLPIEGTRDVLELSAANEVIAGAFLARINMDLRERRGWSYGAFGGPGRVAHQLPYLIQAPVQADRTGDSIAAMMGQLRAFLGADGVTEAELDRVVLGNTRGLPGRFQTGAAILDALTSNALLARPDDYWETLAGRYRRLTAEALDEAARAALDPGRFVWVVVGDAARVRPQLDRLDLPVETWPLG